MSTGPGAGTCGERFQVGVECHVYDEAGDVTIGLAVEQEGGASAFTDETLTLATTPPPTTTSTSTTTTTTDPPILPPDVRIVCAEKKDRLVQCTASHSGGLVEAWRWSVDSEQRGDSGPDFEFTAKPSGDVHVVLHVANGSGGDVDEWIVERLEAVHFAFDDHVILADQQGALDAVIAKLQQGLGFQIEVAGHADEVDTAEYNKRLSCRRAKAVYDYLVEKAGINPELLKVVSHGKSEPRYRSGTRDHWNRRVEFRVLADEESINASDRPNWEDCEEGRS